MSVMARLSLLLSMALLSACASQKSPAPAGVDTQTPTFGLTQYASPSGDEVLISAIGLVGTPYRYGGNTPDSGFDCSGLIGYVYRHVAGIHLPRSTREMQRLSVPNIARHDLSSGDLVFFATNGGRQVSHAGIYVGDGRFVHAPSSGGTVRLDYLSQQYWQSAYLGAKRVLPGSALAQQ